MSKITERVEEIVAPIVESLGFELVDVEYVKEGPDYYLRIAIDKPGGIDIADCALASEHISEVMDKEDPITEAYFMDVSSPGAERPLKKEKDYENAVGNNIYVKLYEPIAGDKEWIGILEQYNEDFITINAKIKTRTKTIEIDRKKIAKIRRAVVL
ncbi:ribosome maturation factor RimP [Macrococcoides bohemicum]|uniref:ribosome maturation factor RimP n=1 Tax=Macrococcoides bohemicum TaxID=1903056 RepID=UPI000BB59187|nr:MULTISPECIES: ribosome maturation factor RimP [Macrococcus]ATD30562.1 ribosome maturation factor RimP [Macrococcus sp. IME1552]QRN49720.1 ribosome maturation factor RimP [Macrococcus bohemicus]QYA45837.1 ribosome maturation factor RimP [Macrococcus bohemicus]TDL37008.1 ribosome maturation factor RimP [Macrococcus bohemicus]